MHPFYGINVSATRIDFQGFMVSNGDVQSMGLDSKEFPNDLMQPLVPGEILQHELSLVRQQLTTAANCHPWIKGWKQHLGPAIQAPIGVAIGVAYAMPPLVRQALRTAFADATRRPGWGNAPVVPVVTVELPLAVAIERHALGDDGEFGIISPGFGRVEATRVVIARDRLSISDFREWSLGNTSTIWNDWTLSNPAIRWLKLSNQSLDIGAVPANVSLETIGPDEVTRGVARYAWSRPANNGTQLLPTIQRVVPRALGIIGRNAAGELFWHRLVNAGEAWPVEPVILRGEFDKQVVINVTCWVDGSSDKEWLPQSQWLGHLHWWQELLAPTHSGTSTSTPNQRLSLTCANPDEGFQFAGSVVDRKVGAGSPNAA